jgi:hypothetical protein
VVLRVSRPAVSFDRLPAYLRAPNGSFTKLRAAAARQRQRGAAVAAIQLEQRDAICNCRDARASETRKGLQPRANRGRLASFSEKLAGAHRRLGAGEISD